MQLGGKEKMVTLNSDLTKYDSRLTKGQKGKTMPNHKCGTFGSFDHFVAVKFENGAIMDIATNSLEFEGEFINM